MPSLMLLLALEGGALAADTADQAEAIRLMDSIESLSARSAFKGVDRQYQQLVMLDAELTAHAHRLGADAARALGDGFERRARLARAEALGDGEAGDELQQLSAAWASTYLVGGPVLVLDPAPFVGDQRAALELANRDLARDGRFYGLLPAGTYTWNEQATFSLEAGTDPLARVGETSAPLTDAYAPIEALDLAYTWNTLTLDQAQMVAVLNSHPEGARVLARARTARTTGLVLALSGIGGLIAAALLPDEGVTGTATSLLVGLPSAGVAVVGIPLFIHGCSGRRRALKRYNRSVTSAVPDASTTP